MKSIGLKKITSCCSHDWKHFEKMF